MARRISEMGDDGTWPACDEINERRLRVIS
jgi:hypothetical protein